MHCDTMKFKIGDYISMTYPSRPHRVWKIYDIDDKSYRVVCIIYNGKSIDDGRFTWNFRIDHVDSTYSKQDEFEVLAKVL